MFIRQGIQNIDYGVGSLFRALKEYTRPVTKKSVLKPLIQKLSKA